jgi:tetratricopeptide (TPR) repeat protein
MQTSKITVAGQFLFLISIFFILNLFLPLNAVALEPLKTFWILGLGIVLGMGVLIQKIKKNSFFVTRNPLWMAVAAILLSSLLSTIFSNNPGISLFGRQVDLASFLGLLALFSLAYGVTSLFGEAQQKGKFFLVTYFSVLLVILVHLLNIFLPFFPEMGFFVNNTINTIGKWYDLGLLALFGALSSVLVLQFLRHSAFYRIAGWVGFGLSIVMMLLVNSLLIWVLAAGFALIYIVLNAIIQHDALVHNRMSYPALAILVVSVILILVGGKIGTISNSFFGFQFEEVRPTFSSTIEVIGDTLKTNPVFGVGVNRFETSWLQNKPLGINASNYWDTDFRYGFSTLLSVPVTHGILGILAWLAFIVMGLYYSFKLLFVPLEQKSDLFVHLYSTLGFMFFMLAMLVYVPSAIMVALFFVFFGFFVANLNGVGLIRYREIHIDQNPRVSFVYILALVILLIAFIYMGFIVASQYSSRVLFDRATAEFSRTGDLQTLESNILRSQFIYGSDLYLRSLTEVGLSKINGLLQNQSLSQEQAVEQFSAVLQTTVGYAQAAVAYDSQSYVNRINLASIYKNLVPLQVPGAKDEALKVLGDIEVLTPNNPSLHLERARVYSLAKEYDPAIDEIRKAVELKSNYVDAVFLLSQIQVEKGEIDQAIGSIQAALTVAPYDPNLYFQLGLLRYNQQKYNESVTAFENAVMLSPYFGNAKYFLGLSYYQNGRTGDAIIQFENLAEMYPDNAEVSFVLNNLKSGKAPLEGAQPPLDESPEDREELPVDEEAPEVDEESAEQE